MALSHSPKIVTDGLVLCLDAGDRKSYSGSGTTWTDRSGNGNDGTLTNGPTFDSDNGGSIVFDGINDYVKIDNIIIANPTSLTVGGWFKRNGDGANYETALHHSSNTSIGSSSYWFGIDLDNKIVGTIGANTGVGWSAGQTTIVANVGVWHHTISTWDGSTVKTYVDGNLEKTYNLTSYNNLTTPTRLGASGDGNGYVMNASISNVFISKNKSFSLDDVLQNYNSAKGRFL
tara:strand:- start:280 stop:972 length:693 start_codon:yes stop_codon:yes gene_type:complete